MQTYLILDGNIFYIHKLFLSCSDYFYKATTLCNLYYIIIVFCVNEKTLIKAD